MCIVHTLRDTHHTRNLCGIVNREIALVGEVQMPSTRFDNLN
jgi:hypothetical protein